MSRLLNTTNQIRENLEARNLYTPENPYDANASNTVDTINTIINIVSPFSSFDLTNTVVGRLVGQNTPLAQIGLQMLGIQFGRTAASNAAAEFLPAVKFNNLFDGDPDSKFLAVKKDFQITRRELQSNIGKILEEITGNYPLKGNPFGQNSTNIDYIKNSGKGQIELLVQNLNANKYKPSDQGLISVITEEGFNYGAEIGIDNRVYYSDFDNIFYPYNQYKISAVIDINSINNRLNKEIRDWRTSTQSSPYYLEYGASQEFVDGLGKTNIFKNSNGAGEYNFEFNAEYNFGLNDEQGLTLLWGRDGVDNNYRFDVEGFDDPIKNSVQPSESGEFIPKSTRFNFTNNEDAFDMDAGGLLSYTRELLNSKGRYGMFDLTKKKFIDKDEQIHFNGSPLRKHLDGRTVDKNRQHNVVDPYDNYVKAIRYNGNKIYNGNKNSVVYNSVVPQIAPTIGGAFNKNLMFSIENLAVKVTADTINPSIAFVDDGNTELPVCEKGPNEGRIMWFPPYDIQINENVVVDRTTTKLVGRGEPIYTYNSTERIATLSFKLIIDYPPQVKGLDHVQASRFFAFGGEIPSTMPSLNDKVREREELIKQKEAIQPTKKLDNPQIPTKSVSFYFANDQPKPNNIGNSWDVETHINKEYELGVNIDGNNFDLNEPFVNDIDKIINELLGEDSLRPFVQVYLEGSASELFSGLTSTSRDYNLQLSRRRVSSMEEYIKGRYKALTNKDLRDDKAPVFILNPIGETGGTSTDQAAEIPTIEAKQARRVFVRFQWNGQQEEVPVPISDKERRDSEVLTEQITALNKEIATIQQEMSNECKFNEYTIEDGVLRGFDSTFNNKYKPAFHSQTPEDFHRRLTFLQQCTRQGRAVRKKRQDNSFSANNAVFGRQPVQILRIGDMFHTKVLIDNMQIDYSDAPWDMNPEGMGMQFMMADIKLQLKLVGGQSLEGPINMLQNAITYNYYANSTFYNDGVYKTATEAANLQQLENNSVSDKENSVEADTEEAATDNTTNKLSES